MNRPLDKITIRGFKSIRSLEDFELRNLNVLIGANGAGKSNFIEFFHMVLAMMKTDGLKQFAAGNADAYFFGGPKITGTINIQMRFGVNGFDFDLSPTEDGFFLIHNEHRHFFGSSQRTRKLGSGHFDSKLIDDQKRPGREAEHGASWHTYQAIRSWMIYHFHDTSTLAGMRRYHDQGHNEALFMDGANIAPFLLKLKTSDSRCYAEILGAIRAIIPFFDDFILEPNAQEKLRLNWRQKGIHDYPMRPSHLSDGSIRFVCLAAALLQPKPPSTIIIDEPEIGLHPEALGILGELVHDAAKRTQVILATQSATLINEFSIEDIVVVNRKDGQSTFERLNKTEFSDWLEDYSVGDLWTKNVIAGGATYE
ncbi:MAG: AAA family ATPase [Gammaproteobacteria bacterium]|nr:AAA family ATPase [Gammaproteobacteria bacterium]MCY4200332.1 AAA family ATPase [Gammaproteobacteria bacterium]MCY4322255.1 AAA family ATPase [Gammaproteobacteria bacterium]